MSKTFNEILEALDLPAGTRTAEIPETVCGPYVGSLVGRANADVISSHAPLVTVYGSDAIGTEWIEIDRDHILSVLRAAGTRERRERVVDQLRWLLDAVQGLGSYPVLCDDAIASLEHQAILDEFEEVCDELLPDLHPDFEGLDPESLRQIKREALEDMWADDMFHFENDRAYLPRKVAHRALLRALCDYLKAN